MIIRSLIFFFLFFLDGKRCCTHLDFRNTNHFIIKNKSYTFRFKDDVYLWSIYRSLINTLFSVVTYYTEDCKTLIKQKRLHDSELLSVTKYNRKGYGPCYQISLYICINLFVCTTFNVLGLFVKWKEDWEGSTTI